MTLRNLHYLASRALGYNFDISHLYTMRGETLMGDKYEEFYVDDDALYQLIIDVFYESRIRGY